VFVVGCLGDWTAAAAVLFERESVRRDSAPRRAQRQATAADASGCAGAGRWWDGGDCAETLTKSNANGAQRMPDKDNFGAVLQPVVGALCADDAKHIGSQYVNQGKCVVQPPAVAQAMIVRRLTPRESERLQGFPDDYTLIPWRKKPAEDCPDGPRYRALGNSMAVNCMEWIGQRIAEIDK